MRYVLLFFVLAGTFSGGTQPAAMKPVACSFFTEANAQKIIGGSVRGRDGEEALPDGGQKWTCTFSAETGENGAKVFFMLMRNKTEDAAKQIFEEVRESNKDHAGFEEWPGVADEAIVHSDGKNFQLVMARQGLKTIRLKVNPARGVSLDETKAIVRSLVLRLK